MTQYTTKSKRKSKWKHSQGKRYGWGLSGGGRGGFHRLAEKERKVRANRKWVRRRRFGCRTLVGDGLGLDLWVIVWAGLLVLGYFAVFGW